ncbi:hypothetical protein L596_022240 [Steinernema carpocapsae]|uniref:Major facilitator superfamily (MFS) profile domain-containing protein n=1 Tax=Steinernema carpocapsae TaxID=34508 RepID=A0A4U5ML61_STECR|nr:hypothetical protein L596_022240 [Steinernema carpocapsae]
MNRRLGLVTAVHALLGSFGDIEANIFNFMAVPIRNMFNESLINHYGLFLESEKFEMVYSSCAVMFYTGILLGVISMGYLLDFCGRKETGVIVRSSLGILAGLCMYLSGKFCSLELFMLGHFLAGLINVFKIALIIYVAECSPDKARGLTGMALGSAGFIMVLAATPLCLPDVLGNNDNWTILPILCALLAAIHLGVSLTFPKSPKHLYITLNNKEKSREAVKFYHGSGVNLDGVEEEYEQEILQQGHATAKEVWESPVLRRSLIIVSLSAFLPTISAITIKSQYHAAMLMSFGMNQSQAMFAIMVILLGAAPLCLVSPWLIERLGRRPLILGATGLCVGEWLLLGSAQFIVDFHFHWNVLSSIFGVTSSVLGQVSVMLGLTSFTAILISEMCPHTARAVISQVSQILPIFVDIVTVAIYPVAIESVGCLFHIPMMVLTVALFYACYKLIPETKGLPVDAIMENIASNVAAIPVRNNRPEQAETSGLSNEQRNVDL